MISFSCVRTEAPVTEYERQRMETMMRNNRMLRSLGIQEAKSIMNTLYQPVAGEDDEQRVFDKVCS